MGARLLRTVPSCPHPVPPTTAPLPVPPRSPDDDSTGSAASLCGTPKPAPPAASPIQAETGGDLGLLCPQQQPRSSGELPNPRRALAKARASAGAPYPHQHPSGVGTSPPATVGALPGHCCRTRGQDPHPHRDAHTHTRRDTESGDRTGSPGIARESREPRVKPNTFTCAQRTGSLGCQPVGTKLVASGRACPGIGGAKGTALVLQPSLDEV